jgi:hypothetical protein
MKKCDSEQEPDLPNQIAQELEGAMLSFEKMLGHENRSNLDSQLLTGIYRGMFISMFFQTRGASIVNDLRFHKIFQAVKTELVFRGILESTKFE